MTITSGRYPLEDIESIEDEDTLIASAHPAERRPSFRLQRRLYWRQVSGDAPGYHPPARDPAQASSDWWRWFCSLDEPTASTGLITFF